MTTMRELLERIADDAQGVRIAAWAWAARVREAGEAMDAAEAVELAGRVEDALAADGAYGLADLVAAGPALGGLDEADLRAVLELVEERAARAARRLALAA